MPAEVWPMVAPHLPKPWPEEAARFDLRWHHDDKGKAPSRYVLAERWGWTPDEVRTELRHPERWWDSAKGPMPTSRKPSDPRRPDVTHADPVTPQTERANADAPAVLTHADPAGPTLTQPRHTRGDPQAQTPPQAPKEEHTQAPKPSPDVVAWEACARVYADEVRPAQRLGKYDLKRGTGFGKDLASMVTAHGGAEVIEVLRYLATVDDDRPGGASFYRREQLNLTNIRRNFPALLDKARNPPTKGARARASPSAGCGEWVDTRTAEERERDLRRGEDELARWGEAS